jgi:cell division protein FtsB|tara:strand:+ start:578 stop:817 length:240 start_codon:yes stop_codon:yes gene_type:complete
VTEKLEKEIERLTMENEGLAERIKGLENRIRLLEHESEDRVPYYIVAKAVHEMQNDLKRLHPELVFNNPVYAPDKVGGV